MTKLATSPRVKLPRPDYGIDAPGVRQGMLTVGSGAMILSAIAAMTAARTTGPLKTAAAWACGMTVLGGIYGLGMASYMTYGSRVGKLKAREKLLDLAEAVNPWTGSESVLDVGCGRGLMMIGAAKRLKAGTAIGIDLWREEDQSNNKPDAVLGNARLEGVADRVRIETGDARSLPFDDATFDVVLSHWVVHNLPSSADQLQALDEMLRVLRPGGTLVLADVKNHQVYGPHLAKVGLTGMRVDTGGAESRIIGFLSGGSFRPHVLAGRRGA